MYYLCYICLIFVCYSFSDSMSLTIKYVMLIKRIEIDIKLNFNKINLKAAPKWRRLVVHIKRLSCQKLLV